MLRKQGLIIKITYLKNKELYNIWNASKTFLIQLRPGTESARFRQYEENQYFVKSYLKSTYGPNLQIYILFVVWNRYFKATQNQIARYWEHPLPLYWFRCISVQNNNLGLLNVNFMTSMLFNFHEQLDTFFSNFWKIDNS